MFDFDRVHDSKTAPPLGPHCANYGARVNLFGPVSRIVTPVNDLIEHCQTILEQAARDKVVYDLNFTLVTGTATWNVDPVLGQPAPGQLTTQPGEQISRTRPSTVQIAIEIKTVMTEHRKAVKNRKRDFEAHPGKATLIRNFGDSVIDVAIRLDQ